MISENSWVSSILGGGVFAALIMAWQQVKAIFERCTSVFVMRITVKETAVSAVQFYCWKKLRVAPSGFRTYITFPRFVRPLERYMQVGFELVSKENRLFWDRWIPILVSAGDNDATITVIRGTVDPDEFMNAAIAEFNDFAHGLSKANRIQRYRVRHCVGRGAPSKRSREGSDVGQAKAPERLIDREGTSRPLRWRQDQLGPISDQDGSMSRMALTAEIEGAVVEAKQWAASQKWYATRQIPWRRGWLLHGKPGTGKTSLVRAIAQLLDMPIFIFDLGTMDNQDFSKAWNDARNETPSIVLFEDIDAVFDGRTNILGDQGGNLTFDAILNAISGIENADGIFTMVTTNRLEKIDGALSRAGRLDRILQLPELNENGRRKIANRILAENPEMIDSVVNEGFGETGAQFQERCGAIALNLYWKSLSNGKQLAEPEPEPFKERYIPFSAAPADPAAHALKHEDV